MRAAPVFGVFTVLLVAAFFFVVALFVVFVVVGMADLLRCIMAQVPPDISDAFCTRWASMCQRLGVDPIDLLRVAYSESNVRANAHNPMGDAVGVIQFMPTTLLGLGWVDGWRAFAALPLEDQVPYVERYMRRHAPLLKSDALCYVATFLPALLEHAAAAGEGTDFVLCARGGPMEWAFKANPGLDIDGDGAITVADLARRLELACRGARYDAIVARVRAANGEPVPPPPEPPPTEPEPFVAADPYDDDD